ncbi:putative protein-translocating porin PorT [Balneicella halophila]|uniref:Outer membrane protein beta-barrel domain-containing protein n=1 Tax=Balneicella halophila TaxID=1537566 RepID=A0A7L4USX3_BALHA|nr:porin family protein [Balneicella halophila]PVX52357.1 putative protein-translocating porin PorT [Balneicella halophila]
MNRAIQYIIIIGLIVCFSTNDMLAQRYKSSSAINYSRVDNTVLHYGYSIGFGVFDYRITNVQYGREYGFLAEPVSFSPAFRLGVIGEWNITNYVSLRSIPGLYFGKRTVTFVREEGEADSWNPMDNLGYPLRKEAEVKSVYADIPLLIKYRGVRINNYNFYLVAGASYHMDLTPHDELKPEKNRIIRTNRHDVALEFGGGMDFYMRYFKLGAELRISIGLIDVMNHDLVEDMPNFHAYTRTIGSMKSTLVTLSFNFE